MLIVISNPQPLVHETRLINRLFEEGMALFHLRKPDYSEEECKKLLNAIPPAFREKIALHQHHQLAENFGLIRFHFPVLQRTNLDGDYLESMKKDFFKYSTSIHSVTEYENLSSIFSYTFLGPVFDSISKPTYKAQQHNMALLKDKRKVPIIGLGGVSAGNCRQLLSMGFDGMAIMGAVWQSRHPVDEFLKIKKRCLIPAP